MDTLQTTCTKNFAEQSSAQHALEADANALEQNLAEVSRRIEVWAETFEQRLAAETEARGKSEQALSTAQIADVQKLNEANFSCAARVDLLDASITEEAEVRRAALAALDQEFRQQL